MNLRMPVNGITALLVFLFVYAAAGKLMSLEAFSRKLEAECRRNVEVMWLCNSLIPKYHTIADFRKRHAGQIREVFQQFVALMCEWRLIGKKTIAIDGTRYRAQNSKKNNYSKDKIQRQMAYIDGKVKDYLEEMNELDQKEKKRKKDVKRLRELARDKEKMQQRKKQYQKLKEQLEQSPNTQISTVDPDARALVIKTDVVEVAYNTQVATDDKHNLIVHYEVTNKMDRKALHPTSLAAKQNMGLGEADKLTVLADKGFFGRRTASCLQRGSYPDLCAESEQPAPHRCTGQRF